ncbi:hypothetical protein AVEN_167818-1 [Araneus ventricosus]|uniref:Uncharacterized protein n=1 Tax=Araneus ventricosus TaxID=182803 RepID=A0A4Y2KJF2_ARAVE|nr:hypothetical protein AVEN_167818-1 [Araneus ventricosus]
MSFNGPTPLDMPRGSGEDDTLLLYGTISRGGRKTFSAVFHAVQKSVSSDLVLRGRLRGRMVPDSKLSKTAVYEDPVQSGVESQKSYH